MERLVQDGLTSAQTVSQSVNSYYQDEVIAFFGYDCEMFCKLLEEEIGRSGCVVDILLSCLTQNV